MSNQGNAQTKELPLASDEPNNNLPETTTTTRQSDIKVESSSQDERIYSIIELPNKLSCLLISDPTTDKAAAAMDVRVGHLSDPVEAPGLAHFLEHMLFMGTKKYPDENDYDSYLSTHGGSSNAFTDMESTNYLFDVASDHLEPSLDRFAQFFIEPLFNVDSTEREMQAVDSEHAKNLQSDFWRAFQLSKSLCKKSHPFSKFGSGNLKTLGEKPSELGLNVRDMLLAFHAKYYSANVMKLVVLGKETIPELQALVETYFSNVLNHDVPIPLFPGEPFGPEQLSKRISVVPVREGMRSLDMNFPAREISTLYKQKPTRYISHLIGHEGVGSILSLLKEKGWANELSAGESRSCSDWSCFTISIDLTDDGLDHVDDVVEIVFAYLSLLKEVGAQRWIHDETATVAECSFRFLSKRNPVDYTCSLAGAMQLYVPEHVLSGPYKVYEYDPNQIEEFLTFFNPENMIMSVTSKKFDGQTQSKESWYGTDYTVENLSKPLCTRWSNATAACSTFEGVLKLPEQNDMIASDFSIVSGEDAPKDEPRLLIDTNLCRLWYKPDNVFDMPKVNIMAVIRTVNAGSTSPEDSVLSTLWVQILMEHSNDFTYLASMASLHCSVVNVNQGIELTVSGFSHKAHILLKRIIKCMVELSEKVDTSLFQRVKDKIAKSYQNFVSAQPYQHAINAGDICLEANKWSIEERLDALEGLALQDVISFSHRLLSRFDVELLVHGNVSTDDAKEISNIILDGLKPRPSFESTRPQSRVVKLKDGCDYVHRFPEPNANNTNSCVEILFQIGPVGIKDNAVLAFLQHLVREPAYNELRTHEQLGYIVHSSLKTNGDAVKSLLFLIQSDSKDPTYLDSRIENFLDGFRSKMVKMSSEEFETNVEAVVQTFLEKNKNLGEESGQYWNPISNKTYLFKKRNLLATEVKDLSMFQVLQFFDKFIVKNAPRRKKISVQVFALQHLEHYDDPVPESITLVRPEEVVDFKRSMSLYELPDKVDVECYKI